MLDLDTLQLPPIVVKLNGEEHSFDTVILAYKMQQLVGESDPAKLAQEIGKIVELPLTPVQALAFVQEFDKHMRENEEVLKNVLGRSPSSITTTEPPPETMVVLHPPNT